MLIVRIEDGSVGYGDERTILSGIDLDIRAGEKVAVIGESGSGQSTLLNYIYGNCKSTAALVPQLLGLADNLSVFHNIYMGQLDTRPFFANVRNLVRPTKQRLSEIDEILERLELQDKTFARPTTLSGGQRQRIAIGRALYRGTDILIADEPCSALDDRQSDRVLDMLISSYETAIIALHDVAAARQIADRVIGLKDGKIHFDAPPGDLSDRDIAALYPNT